MTGSRAAGPYNTARALARLGSRVAFLGRLSTDRFGRTLRPGSKRTASTSGWRRSTDEPTLLARRRARRRAAPRPTGFDADGSAAAGLEPGDIGAGLPRETVALHVGHPGPRPRADGDDDRGARRTRSRDDVLVMADPNIRPSAIRDVAGYRERLGGLMARFDVVKASVDDLLGWSRRSIRSPPRIASSGPARPSSSSRTGRIDPRRRAGRTVVVQVPDVPVVEPSAPATRSAPGSWRRGRAPADAARRWRSSTRSRTRFGSVFGSARGRSAAPARTRPPWPTSGLLDRQLPVHLVRVDRAPEGIEPAGSPPTSKVYFPRV